MANYTQDQVEALLRQVEEAERRAEAAERRAEEDRHTREAAERRAEEDRHTRDAAERRAEEDRHTREAAERRAEEDRHTREAAERRAEEDRHLREAAELMTNKTTLTEFLKLCHDLRNSISVVRDPSSTTGGILTDATGRLYPRLIVPSSDEWHQKIWAMIPENCHFTVAQQFFNRSHFESLEKSLPTVSSELSLLNFHSRVMDDMLKEMIAAAAYDDNLRDVLQLRYTFDIQHHGNIGEEGNARNTALMQNAYNAQKENKPETLGRFMGTPDQYYIATDEIEQSRQSIILIEAKAPHKLSTHEVLRGLEKNIHVARDVLNTATPEDEDEDENDRRRCQRSMAAVITQLFSYMVHRRVRRGCIITGEAYVYVRVDDPAVAQVKVHIPEPDDDVRHTALARMFAFVVEAASLPPFPQSWSTTGLSPWKEGSVSEVPEQMPDSVKSNASDLTYKPTRSKKSVRSPIKTRSSCKPAQGKTLSDTTSSGSDGHDDEPGSPSVQKRQRQEQSSRQEPSKRQAGLSPQKTRERGRDKTSSGYGKASSAGQRRYDSLQPMSHWESRGIRNASYCSHACLNRLVARTAADPHCPNQSLHPSAIPTLQEFLTLVKEQLRRDRGPDADCLELGLSGATGSIFKVRLSSHGYTFVAKAVRAHDSPSLSKEHQRYGDIRHLQGDVVPVSLGIVELDIAYHAGIRVLSHFLLLSYGGSLITAGVNAPYRHLFPALAQAALSKLHACGVLHSDLALRNILFDRGTGRLMFVDLEKRERGRWERPLTFKVENADLKEMLTRLCSPDQQAVGL